MVSLKVYMYIRVDLLCIFKFIRSAHCHQLLEFISDMKEYIILRFHPQDKTKGNIADQFRGFPHSSVGKESACHVGNLGSIPGLGRSHGEGKVYPLQFSGLENSMDSIVHRVAESDTTERLSLEIFCVSQSILYFKSPKLTT